MILPHTGPHNLPKPVSLDRSNRDADRTYEGNFAVCVGVTGPSDARGA